MDNCKSNPEGAGIDVGRGYLVDYGRKGKNMIQNPFDPGNPVYDMSFNLFAMEEEGYLLTHRGILNGVAKYIAEGYDFYEACDEAGVDWELTNEDIDYINSRV